MTIENIVEQARITPPAELPAFLGKLEEARATAFARLVTPIPQPPKAADRLLNIAQTATLLGCGKSILYHGLQGLNARRVGRKVMFSEVEVQRYINSRR